MGRKCALKDLVEFTVHRFEAGTTDPVNAGHSSWPTFSTTANAVARGAEVLAIELSRGGTVEKSRAWQSGVLTAGTGCRCHRLL